MLAPYEFISTKGSSPEMQPPSEPGAVVSLSPRTPRLSSALRDAGSPIAIPADGLVYRQGDAADSLYYLESGVVRIGAKRQGKHAVIGLHGPGTFFGECCLARAARIATASAIFEAAVKRIPKVTVLELAQRDPLFSQQVMTQFARRVARLEEDLIDRSVSSTEKRMARALLFLASLDEDQVTLQALARDNQQGLAEIVGTTPSRVRHFLAKFTRQGYIAPQPPLKVHSSLVKVLLAGRTSE